MTALGESRKGQPLIFLALVLVAWIGVRTSAFQTPWGSAHADEMPLQRGLRTGKPSASPPASTVPAKTVPLADRTASQADAAPRVSLPHAHVNIRHWSAHVGQASIAAALQSDAPALIPPSERQAPRGSEVQGLQANAPDAPPGQHAVKESRAYPDGTLPSAIDRWRFDGWLLLRGGITKPASAGQQASSYGASQLGAVLTYRLSPRSRRVPSAYLRVSQALIDNGESVAALGVSLRALPRLPVTAYAELRATRRQGRTELRPSAFVAGGFDRQRIPLGLRLRGYAAAGYVGGDFATAFIDGHAVADAETARFDLGSVRAGAGIWGGAQRGASRLDIGPTASLDVELGDAPVRLSLDYRQRVAGAAMPASGAVLTLSTGF